MRKISFVIPCYASEDSISNVLLEIKNTMNERNGFEYEVILVDDHSPDSVWHEIVRLSKENNNIKGISLAKNFGQHSAFMAGYRYATGEIIISLDDDGQTPANEVYNLIDKIDEGYDVVYAAYDNKCHSKLRNLDGYQLFCNARFYCHRNM